MIPRSYFNNKLVNDSNITSTFPEIPSEFIDSDCPMIVPKLKTNKLWQYPEEQKIKQSVESSRNSMNSVNSGEQAPLQKSTSSNGSHVEEKRSQFYKAVFTISNEKK